MKIVAKKFPVFLLSASSLISTNLSAGIDVDTNLLPLGGNGVINLQASGYFGNHRLSAHKNGTKINPDLMHLHQEYQSYLSSRASKTSPTRLPFKSENKFILVSGETVLIDAAASGDAAKLAGDMRALGASNVRSYGRAVSGRVPLGAIRNLDKLKSLHSARPAYMSTNVGTVTSQGDAALRADVARASFAVNGAGVKVGTLSDSYNCLGGAAQSVIDGDLPSGVTVLEEEDDCISGSDEGRAMMEIIHDVAPGASLAFHTAFNGMADFAQGIVDLAHAGAKVITDDVVYFAEPFYQDGIVAQAVDAVKAGGVAYFSSAGNQDREAYESPFRRSGKFFELKLEDGTIIGPYEVHDFDSGPGVDTCQQITIPVFSSIAYVFQWDQPFFSVSGGAGSKSDIDIIVTNADCTQVLTGSIVNNLGDDPFEFFSADNIGPETTFGIMILHLKGPKPSRMKFVNFGDSDVTLDQFATHSPTSFGHNSALGGLGVAAANYLDTPEFGTPVPVAESFSSAGGSPILFSKTGKRLGIPEIRQQPAITAPDGADTSFFYADTDDAGSFPNFFGTSAAAPHAAGVAALLKDLVPSATPDQIYAALKSTAIDMDDAATTGFDSGFDFSTGFGLIQADGALAALNPGSSGVHDLAVTKILPIKTITGRGARNKIVKVTIQNRSPHSETIEPADLGNGLTTGLVRLNVNVIDDDGENCSAAQVSLNSTRSLPATKVLAPKKKLTLFYNVRYQCAQAQQSKKDATPGDYNHLASVYHEVLDGNPDSDLVDDLCPRSVTPPFVIDPNPNGTIKDKGCGAPKVGKVFGNPVITNVVK